ncbi:CCR4-NOT transcription complex subunit 7 [Rhynchospora pubera]|uniref:CCR4-NOT transcription complex subunit 7 n=1 Tax=Rhynchospora pubera TaxID=906938 RepID=A0AAV8E326_9POAL|nr:CCR4-NOT transcription complex subunit 7 [Rhynchospora pubera]
MATALCYVPLIQSVWASNLEAEFERISWALHGHGYSRVTVDTEFYLARPDCSSNNIHPHCQSPEQRYKDVRARVDGGLGIRQLGLTLSSDHPGYPDLVWEFNFGCGLHRLPLDLETDNIQPKPQPWPRHQDPRYSNMEPINSYNFSKLLHYSGLLCNFDVTWVFFHSAYDIAFLLKLATFYRPLPPSLSDFYSGITTFFGGSHCIFDLKYLSCCTNHLYGGLDHVSKSLGVERIAGEAHQAGSDSLLTSHTYECMIYACFPFDRAARHAGILYGIHHI